MNDVELDRREEFLDRPRHIDREARRAAPGRARNVENLTHSHHARAAPVGSLEQRMRFAPRGPQLPARVTYAILRA